MNGRKLLAWAGLSLGLVAFGLWIVAICLVANRGMDTNPGQCPWGGQFGSCTGWLTTYRPVLIVGIGVGLAAAWVVLCTILEAIVNLVTRLKVCGQ
jgi:hypothetical protein